MRKGDVHLHPKACTLGVSSVKYLAHVVTRQDVPCVPDRVEAIDAIPALPECQY